MFWEEYCGRVLGLGVVKRWEYFDLCSNYVRKRDDAY